MDIAVREEAIAGVAGLAEVPIAFRVDRRVVVSATDGGFALSERPVEVPWVKDYDAIESPASWLERCDLSRWGLIAATVGGRRGGTVVVAFDTPGVDLLEGRTDLAVVWDIRVAPDLRGQGVGSALFQAAEAWAAARGCRQLKVETQDINVAACRFYARHGCVLRAVDRSAYDDFPDETQLLWYKDLP